MVTGTDDERALIEATHDGRLAASTDATAATVCAAIGQRVAVEAGAVRRALADRGIGGVELVGDVDAPAQLHAIEATAPNADTAERVAEALTSIGYTRWDDHGPAARRLQRSSGVLTVARTTDVTVAVRIRWPVGSRRLPGPLRPNAADFTTVRLPAPLWPLYVVIRPIRLVAERLGLRSTTVPELGPFLSTPDDLIEPLLDVAEVGPDDLVVDIGCGDGRLVVASAARGARARGVELDPILVEAARRRADDAGVADRVEVIEGDGSTLPMADATVALVFLPAEVMPSVAGRLLDAMPNGARIVAHEQRRPAMGGTRPPDQQHLLLAGQGVTVAHRWDVVS